MRERYDVVVIGGGHNGIVAAIELARADWSVLVVEQRESIGGCASTTEPLLPGFKHSPHANSLMFVDIMPETISPATLGVRVHQPAAQLGVTFSDGRPPVILHRPDLLDMTRESLGAYSRTDARTYAELKQRSDALGPVLRQGLYTTPDPSFFAMQRAEVLSRFKDFRQPHKLGSGTARQLVDDLFKTPEIRMLLYMLATETGIDLEEVGGDIAFLSYSLWIAGRWRFPIGGMQNYSDALHRAAVATGAEVACSAGAAKIAIHNGRAVGVETLAGDIINASRAVLSATPILQLFDNLLTADALSHAERTELRRFRSASLPSIGTSLFCLEQAPNYKSAHYDATINACLKTAVGFETPRDVLEHHLDVGAGRLPKPAGIVRLHSVWDETLAPSGCHVAGLDSTFPAASRLDRDTWHSVANTFPMAFVDAWQDYLAGEQVTPPLAMSFDHSEGFERRMLLRTGSDQYRTSIPGLYLGGPGIYPGGGVHGACGLNAVKIIIEDWVVAPH